MKNQLSLSAVICAVLLSSCGPDKTATQNPEQSANATGIDTSVIAVLPFDTSYHWLFRDAKPAYLNGDDIRKTETLLKECLADHNLEQEDLFKELDARNPDDRLDRNHFVIDLARYKRQYTAVVNAKGEKEVWVNCFCSEPGYDWKKQILGVADGGNCYFNLKINLATGNCYDFQVNGDA